MQVMWEPFIEPSKFQLNVIRKCANHALDISPSTEVWLNSSNQLNLNISEPFIEVSYSVILHFHYLPVSKLPCILFLPISRGDMPPKDNISK